MQDAIHGAEELAHRYDYIVGDDGSVTDTFAGKEPPPEMHPEDRARAHDQVVADLQQAARTAEDIDNDLATVFDRAAQGGFSPGGATTVAAAAATGAADLGLTLPPPPPDATPAQNAAWWATLSPAGKALYLQGNPEQVGSLDGLPATARNDANHIVLDRTRAGLLDERATLEQELKRYQGAPLALQQPLFARIDKIDKLVAGIDQITQRVDHPRPGQPPAYILGIDSKNAGHAIIAVGNPDTSSNVATYVPGTTAGLDGVNTDIYRADAMAASAGRAGSPSTSVIMWAGYDAPQDLGEAASTSYADKAEPSLHRFQEGLNASHSPEPMTKTVLGHSYGTTVVGQTARDMGLSADRLVMVASPGIGVEHARDLKLDGVPSDQVGDRLYSTEAATDPIPLATNFRSPATDNVDPLGPDPTMPWFGGHSFESDPGSPISSHGDYWNRDSRSLRSIGSLIAGGRPN
ncbi:alpha/beta hydrolase [Amycolatopsis sp. CA-230715]|uniref:alpha/beta hydrolase n=1 Tax=Amycolatopsis sp. CA-230715 TaxID=2745196 RepID=UPI001C00A994|nr:alpha/beta hydrolase [Amycolatopsis sp. CA-230715]QWF79284.1 hypothetical protein HUW46_02691 [Amycolatopsis sp. CA-230715]